MIPYIITPIGNLATFIVMIAIGVLLFLIMTYRQIKRGKNAEKEVSFIFPKITYSMLIACVSAGVFDSLFKIGINQKFIIRGASFYGGLLGGIISIYIMLFLKSKETQYTRKEWFDYLTPPLIIFHICGRIGCFFAGCCYGKETQSLLGIVFPDNPANDIYHYGARCYPTQLFEVCALIIIFIWICKVKEKFNTYIVLYGVSRFIIEFFRGDNRGEFFGFLSPAQVISLVLMAITVIKIAVLNANRKDCVKNNY